MRKLSKKLWARKPFKWKLRPREGFYACIWGSCENLIKYGSKLRTSEPRPTLTGSYKKRVHFQTFGRKSYLINKHTHGKEKKMEFEKSFNILYAQIKVCPQSEVDVLGNRYFWSKSTGTKRFPQKITRKFRSPISTAVSTENNFSI